MNLSYQKRVASELLKCGLHRVWVDDRPEVQERISEAVTRDDVRLLIVQRFIRKHRKKESREVGQKKWLFNALKDGVVDRVQEKDMAELELQRKKLG